MAAYQYELLKCEGCGKTLGYIFVSAKSGFGFFTSRYWVAQHGPSIAVKKIAFCESCFQKRVDETSKDKLEPKSEKAESVEPQAKRKGRPLVR